MITLRVLVALVCTSACGGKQQEPAPPPVVGNEAPPPTEEPVAERSRRPSCTGGSECSLRWMRYFRDEMCLCADSKDKVCAQRIVDDMTAFAQESARSARAEKSDAASSREMEQIGQQLGECTTKAYMSEPGGSP